MPYGHSIKRAYAEGRKLMNSPSTERAARCPNCRIRRPRELDFFTRDTYARTPGIAGTRDLCETCYQSGILLLCPPDEFHRCLAETIGPICEQALRDELSGERRANYAIALQHRIRRIQRERNKLPRPAGNQQRDF